jgi:hypothetical protein
MASSTTIAIASSRADSVSRLMENPKIQRKRNVPTRATGTAIIGISVERKSCKKIYTTMNTSTRVIKFVNDIIYYFSLYLIIYYFFPPIAVAKA